MVIPSSSWKGLSSHDLAVLEGAGLALVGVADDVGRQGRVLRDEARLAAHGEAGARRARAGRSARTRRRPRRGPCSCERLAQRLVAARAAVVATGPSGAAPPRAGGR